jgi:hypothetical protein
MDNQHTLIAGYRELTEGEIALMNIVKEKGEALADIVDLLSRDDTLDQRWVAIGKTHLQQGVMALVRAVAQPTTF